MTSQSQSPAKTDIGLLRMIMGPMFSGKSTEGLKMIRMYAIHFGMDNILRIKYSKDTRYSHDEIATHDKITAKAVTCTKLSELEDSYKKYKAIYIDEGQFFPDIVEFTEKALDEGINIVISGLDADFRRKPFANNWLSLITESVFTVKLVAICEVCSAPAPHTFRMTKDTSQELIGGSEMYQARCRKCHVCLNVSK
jgi:thymidine kinase